jgi:hypothetical protein
MEATKPVCFLLLPHELLKDQNCTKQEIMSGNQNTPRLARNTHLAHLGAPRVCQNVVLSIHIWPKPGTLGACLGGKRPENGQNATGFGSASPKQKNMSETKNTPTLVRMHILLI